MFQESQLACNKLTGNQQRTILVLRFDAMADTSVSTSHQSTSAIAGRSMSPQSIKKRQKITSKIFTAKRGGACSPQTTESKTNQTAVTDRTNTT
ncbi:hypothetical protein ElyMa_001137600 [Elysia marginata]|uniref:Uncharacterized protein n=1 Tax=Elysia marginata TaxID=1093978 RepID=A0AAV4I0K7_9GAST|nr:hypothetical protein ElyMa_001137600 [Elysia marginata]